MPYTPETVQEPEREQPPEEPIEAPSTAAEARESDARAQYDEEGETEAGRRFVRRGRRPGFARRRGATQTRRSLKMPRQAYTDGSTPRAPTRLDEQYAKQYRAEPRSPEEAYADARGQMNQNALAVPDRAGPRGEPKQFEPEPQPQPQPQPRADVPGEEPTPETAGARQEQEQEIGGISERPRAYTPGRIGERKERRTRMPKLGGDYSAADRLNAFVDEERQRAETGYERTPGGESDYDYEGAIDTAEGHVSGFVDEPEYTPGYTDVAPRRAYRTRGSPFATGRTRGRDVFDNRVAGEGQTGKRRPGRPRGSLNKPKLEVYIDGNGEEQVRVKQVVRREVPVDENGNPIKRPRGRPPGSKNKRTIAREAAMAEMAIAAAARAEGFEPQSQSQSQETIIKPTQVIQTQPPIRAVAPAPMRAPAPAPTPVDVGRQSVLDAMDADAMSSVGMGNNRPTYKAETPRPGVLDAMDADAMRSVGMGNDRPAEAIKQNAGDWIKGTAGIGGGRPAQKVEAGDWLSANAGVGAMESVGMGEQVQEKKANAADWLENNAGAGSMESVGMGAAGEEKKANASDWLKNNAGIGVVEEQPAKKVGANEWFADNAGTGSMESVGMGEQIQEKKANTSDWLKNMGVGVAEQPEQRVDAGNWLSDNVGDNSMEDVGMGVDGEEKASTTEWLKKNMGVGVEEQPEQKVGAGEWFADNAGDNSMEAVGMGEQVQEKKANATDWLNNMGLGVAEEEKKANASDWLKNMGVGAAGEQPGQKVGAGDWLSSNAGVGSMESVGMGAGGDEEKASTTDWLKNNMGVGAADKETKKVGAGEWFADNAGDNSMGAVGMGAGGDEEKANTSDWLKNVGIGAEERPVQKVGATDWLENMGIGVAEPADVQKVGAIDWLENMGIGAAEKPEQKVGAGEWFADNAGDNSMEAVGMGADREEKKASTTDWLNNMGIGVAEEQPAQVRATDRLKNMGIGVAEEQPVKKAGAIDLLKKMGIVSGPFDKVTIGGDTYSGARAATYIKSDKAPRPNVNPVDAAIPALESAVIGGDVYGSRAEDTMRAAMGYVGKRPVAAGYIYDPTTGRAHAVAAPAGTDEGAEEQAAHARAVADYADGMIVRTAVRKTKNGWVVDLYDYNGRKVGTGGSYYSEEVADEASEQYVPETRTNLRKIAIYDRQLAGTGEMVTDVWDDRRSAADTAAENAAEHAAYSRMMAETLGISHAEAAEATRPRWHATPAKDDATAAKARLAEVDSQLVLDGYTPSERKAIRAEAAQMIMAGAAPEDPEQAIEDAKQRIQYKRQGYVPTGSTPDMDELIGVPLSEGKIKRPASVQMQADIADQIRQNKQNHREHITVYAPLGAGAWLSGAMRGDFMNVGPDTTQPNVRRAAVAAQQLGEGMISRHVHSEEHVSSNEWKAEYDVESPGRTVARMPSGKDFTAKTMGVRDDFVSVVVMGFGVVDVDMRGARVPAEMKGGKNSVYERGLRDLIVRLAATDASDEQINAAAFNYFRNTMERNGAKVYYTPMAAVRAGQETPLVRLVKERERSRGVGIEFDAPMPDVLEMAGIREAPRVGKQKPTPIPAEVRDAINAAMKHNAEVAATEKRVKAAKSDLEFLEAELVRARKAGDAKAEKAAAARISELRKFVAETKVPERVAVPVYKPEQTQANEDMTLEQVLGQKPAPASKKSAVSVILGKTPSADATLDAIVSESRGKQTTIEPEQERAKPTGMTFGGLLDEKSMAAVKSVLEKKTAVMTPEQKKLYEYLKSVGIGDEIARNTAMSAPAQAPAKSQSQSQSHPRMAAKADTLEDLISGVPTPAQAPITVSPEERAANAAKAKADAVQEYYKLRQETADTPEARKKSLPKFKKLYKKLSGRKLTDPKVVQAILTGRYRYFEMKSGFDEAVSTAAGQQGGQSAFDSEIERVADSTMSDIAPKRQQAVEIPWASVGAQPSGPSTAIAGEYLIINKATRPSDFDKILPEYQRIYKELTGNDMPKATEDALRAGKKSVYEKESGLDKLLDLRAKEQAARKSKKDIDDTIDEDEEGEIEEAVTKKRAVKPKRAKKKAKTTAVARMKEPTTMEEVLAGGRVAPSKAPAAAQVLDKVGTGDLKELYRNILGVLPDTMSPAEKTAARKTAWATAVSQSKAKAPASKPAKPKASSMEDIIAQSGGATAAIDQVISGTESNGKGPVEFAEKLKRNAVFIPFQPDMIDASLADDKTATTRTKIFGKAGQHFFLNNQEFVIERVEKKKLGDVAKEYYKKEGFRSKEEFIAKWEKLHPKAKFNPHQPVYVHHYHKLKEGELSERHIARSPAAAALGLAVQTEQAVKAPAKPAKKGKAPTSLDDIVAASGAIAQAPAPTYTEPAASKAASSGMDTLSKPIVDRSPRKKTSESFEEIVAASQPGAEKEKEKEKAKPAKAKAKKSALEEIIASSTPAAPVQAPAQAKDVSDIGELGLKDLYRKILGELPSDMSAADKKAARKSAWATAVSQSKASKTMLDKIIETQPSKPVQAKAPVKAAGKHEDALSKLTTAQREQYEWMTTKGGIDGKIAIDTINFLAQQGISTPRPAPSVPKAAPAAKALAKAEKKAKVGSLDEIIAASQPSQAPAPASAPKQAKSEADSLGKFLDERKLRGLGHGVVVGKAEPAQAKTDSASLKELYRNILGELPADMSAADKKAARKSAWATALAQSKQSKSKLDEIIAPKPKAPAPAPTAPTAAPANAADTTRVSEDDAKNVLGVLKEMRRIAKASGGKLMILKEVHEDYNKHTWSYTLQPKIKDSDRRIDGSARLKDPIITVRQHQDTEWNPKTRTHEKINTYAVDDWVEYAAEYERLITGKRNVNTERRAMVDAIMAAAKAKAIEKPAEKAPTEVDVKTIIPPLKAAVPAPAPAPEKPKAEKAEPAGEQYDFEHKQRWDPLLKKLVGTKADEKEIKAKPKSDDAISDVIPAGVTAALSDVEKPKVTTVPGRKTKGKKKETPIIRKFMENKGVGNALYDEKTGKFMPVSEASLEDFVNFTSTATQAPAATPTPSVAPAPAKARKAETLEDIVAGAQAPAAKKSEKKAKKAKTETLEDIVAGAGVQTPPVKVKKAEPAKKEKVVKTPAVGSLGELFGIRRGQHIDSTPFEAVDPNFIMDASFPPSAKDIDRDYYNYLRSTGFSDVVKIERQKPEPKPRAVREEKKAAKKETVFDGFMLKGPESLDLSKMTPIEISRLVNAGIVKAEKALPNNETIVAGGYYGAVAAPDDWRHEMNWIPDDLKPFAARKPRQEPVVERRAEPKMSDLVNEPAGKQEQKREQKKTMRTTEAFGFSIVAPDDLDVAGADAVQISNWVNAGMAHVTGQPKSQPAKSKPIEGRKSVVLKDFDVVAPEGMDVMGATPAEIVDMVNAGEIKITPKQKPKRGLLGTLWERANEFIPGSRNANIETDARGATSIVPLKIARAGTPAIPGFDSLVYSGYERDDNIMNAFFDYEEGVRSQKYKKYKTWQEFHANDLEWNLDFAANYAQHYVDISHRLRKGKPLKEHRRTVSLLDQVIKERKTPFNMVLFRGVGNVEKMLGKTPEDSVGQIYKDKAFTSTSYSPDVALGYAGQYNSKGAFMRIKAPEGFHAYPVTAIYQQLVLGREQPIKITGITGKMRANQWPAHEIGGGGSHSMSSLYRGRIIDAELVGEPNFEERDATSVKRVLGVLSNTDTSRGYANILGRTPVRGGYGNRPVHPSDEGQRRATSLLAEPGDKVRVRTGKGVTFLGTLISTKGDKAYVAPGGVGSRPIQSSNVIAVPARNVEPVGIDVLNMTTGDWVMMPPGQKKQVDAARYWRERAVLDNIHEKAARAEEERKKKQSIINRIVPRADATINWNLAEPSEGTDLFNLGDTVAELRWITPKQYTDIQLDAVERSFGDDGIIDEEAFRAYEKGENPRKSAERLYFGGLNKGHAEELKLKMLSGSPFGALEIPFTASGEPAYQEGRHRSTAAEMAGARLIPVWFTSHSTLDPDDLRAEFERDHRREEGETPAEYRARRDAYVRRRVRESIKRPMPELGVGAQDADDLLKAVEERSGTSVFDIPAGYSYKDWYESLIPKTGARTNVMNKIEDVAKYTKVTNMEAGAAFSSRGAFLAFNTGHRTGVNPLSTETDWKLASAAVDYGDDVIIIHSHPLDWMNANNMRYEWAYPASKKDLDSMIGFVDGKHTKDIIVQPYYSLIGYAPTKLLGKHTKVYWDEGGSQRFDLSLGVRSRDPSWMEPGSTRDDKPGEPSYHEVTQALYWNQKKRISKWYDSVRPQAGFLDADPVFDMMGLPSDDERRGTIVKKTSAPRQAVYDDMIRLSGLTEETGEPASSLFTTAGVRLATVHGKSRVPASEDLLGRIMQAKSSGQKVFSVHSHPIFKDRTLGTKYKFAQPITTNELFGAGELGLRGSIVLADGRMYAYESKSFPDPALLAESDLFEDTIKTLSSGKYGGKSRAEVKAEAGKLLYGEGLVDVGDAAKVLGVSRTATPWEIKQAYHAKAIEFHPDKNDSPAAAEKMKAINAAYDAAKQIIDASAPSSRKRTVRAGGDVDDLLNDYQTLKVFDVEDANVRKDVNRITFAANLRGQRRMVAGEITPDVFLSQRERLLKTRPAVTSVQTRIMSKGSEKVFDVLGVGTPIKAHGLAGETEKRSATSVSELSELDSFPWPTRMEVKGKPPAREHIAQARDAFAQAFGGTDILKRAKFNTLSFNKPYRGAENVRDSYFLSSGLHKFDVNISTRHADTNPLASVDSMIYDASEADTTIRKNYDIKSPRVRVALDEIQGDMDALLRTRRSVAAGKPDTSYLSNFARPAEFTRMGALHELGHAYHYTHSEEIVDTFDDIEARFNADPAFSRGLAAKYSPTRRGHDDFGEAVAESFALYSIGKVDLLNPRMAGLLRDTTKPELVRSEMRRGTSVKRKARRSTSILDMQAVALPQEFDKKKVRPVSNMRGFNKPVGGLWSSTYDPGTGYTDWTKWTKREMPGLHESQRYLYAIKPTADVRVFTVDDRSDANKLFARYPGPALQFNDMPGYRVETVNYKSMAKDYDVLHLTTSGMVSNSHEYGKPGVLSFYGWDVGSAVWLNKDAYDAHPLTERVRKPVEKKATKALSEMSDREMMKSLFSVGAGMRDTKGVPPEGTLERVVYDSQRRGTSVKTKHGEENVFNVSGMLGRNKKSADKKLGLSEGSGMLSDSMAKGIMSGAGRSRRRSQDVAGNAFAGASAIMGGSGNRKSKSSGKSNDFLGMSKVFAESKSKKPKRVRASDPLSLSLPTESRRRRRPARRGNWLNKLL